MKKIIFLVFAAITALNVVSQSNPVKKPVLKPQPSKIDPKILNKANPQTILGFTIDNQRHDLADVTIQCSIKNNSINSFFLSDASDSAHAILYQKYPGSARRSVWVKSFTSMPPGEEIKFSYHMDNWSNSMEFPPDYELVIIYPAPKKTTNNDGNLHDNMSILNGLDINRAIR